MRQTSESARSSATSTHSQSLRLTGLLTCCPADDLLVLLVLALQPVLQGLEVVAQRGGVHFPLSGDRLHGVRPRLRRAQRQHFTGEQDTGKRVTVARDNLNVCALCSINDSWRLADNKQVTGYTK